MMTSSITTKLIVIFGITLTIIAGSKKISDLNMSNIKFKLRENIEQVARSSGAPSFHVRRLAGNHRYEISGLPPEVVIYYTPPGYEIKISPAFSLSLYADERNHNNLSVDEVSITPKYDAKSNKSVRALVDNIVAQFNDGKWKRLIPQHCPAVTGRSAILNAEGNVGNQHSCPLDPHYKITESEWNTLLKNAQQYHWLGDGVRAELHITRTGTAADPLYFVSLEFKDETISTLLEQENLAIELREGDAAGWGSTARYRVEQEQIRKEVKLLEENAIRRGDKVVPRS